MKNQNEKESKKIDQRKGNEKSQRKQKKAIGKLAGWGGWWCRKAWKDQSKKEMRRNEGNELEKQAVSMKEKE